MDTIYSGFETFFGTDLDEDGVSGINSSDLAFAPLDQYGYRLKKDEDNLLYIVDSNDENTISFLMSMAVSPSFDWSHNWGSGSHNSSAVAVEQNSDNTFSLAVKHEDTWDGETHLNWEILSISSEGVLNWNNTVWTEDISLYEKTIFNDDLDEDGSKGVNLEALVSVTTDTTGAQLKSDSLEQRYYIQDGDKTVGVSHLWGGWIDFSQNEAWGTSTFVREPLAVEAHSFKSSEGENVAGYIVATKNTFTDSWGENIEFEIEYVLPSGIVDEGLRVHTNSIKNKESLFGQDLDGDTAIGLDPTKFSAISTDTYGDLLKYQGEVLYIIDDKDTEIATDDSVIEIVDAGIILRGLTTRNRGVRETIYKKTRGQPLL